MYSHSLTYARELSRIAGHHTVRGKQPNLKYQLRRINLRNRERKKGKFKLRNNWNNCTGMRAKIAYESKLSIIYRIRNNDRCIYVTRTTELIDPLIERGDLSRRFQFSNFSDRRSCMHMRACICALLIK